MTDERKLEACSGEMTLDWDFAKSQWKLSGRGEPEGDAWRLFASGMRHAASQIWHSQNSPSELVHTKDVLNAYMRAIASISAALVAAGVQIETGGVTVTVLKYIAEQERRRVTLVAIGNNDKARK